jgi:hypothetical protein
MKLRQSRKILKNMRFNKCRYKENTQVKAHIKIFLTNVRRSRVMKSRGYSVPFFDKYAEYAKQQFHDDIKEVFDIVDNYFWQHRVYKLDIRSL